MKVCTKCSIEKLESEFFLQDKSTGRLHAECKLCYKAHRTIYYKQHYEKNKIKYRARAVLRHEKLRQDFRANMLTYLAGKYCEVCGEDDIRVLEFDHLDPGLKSFNISKSVALGFN